MSNQIIDLNVNEAEWDPMNPHFAQEETKMLDCEGRLVNQSLCTKDFFEMEILDSLEYEISKVNVMGEDEYLVERILALSVNDGTGQGPPENKNMGSCTSPTLMDISQTLDPVAFVSDIVERSVLSKF